MSNISNRNIWVWAINNWAVFENVWQNEIFYDFWSLILSFWSVRFWEICKYQSNLQKSYSEKIVPRAHQIGLIQTLEIKLRRLLKYFVFSTFQKAPIVNGSYSNLKVGPYCCPPCYYPLAIRTSSSRLCWIVLAVLRVLPNYRLTIP